MIETVAEHSFETLAPGSKILDLGCRGFLFTDEMHRRGHKVCAVDIDKLGRDDYHQIAISNYVGRAGIKRDKDPQATSICKGGEVMCMDLEMLCTFTQTPFWDLIKMDIEGSEYEVIMSLTRPLTKQLSIEFHLHTGAYKIHDVVAMRVKLFSLGYIAVQHELTEAHGCGKNFWDSVFVLNQ